MAAHARVCSGERYTCPYLMTRAVHCQICLETHRHEVGCKKIGLVGAEGTRVASRPAVAVERAVRIVRWWSSLRVWTAPAFTECVEELTRVTYGPDKARAKRFLRQVRTGDPGRVWAAILAVDPEAFRVGLHL